VYLESTLVQAIEVRESPQINSFSKGWPFLGHCLHQAQGKWKSPGLLSSVGSLVPPLLHSPLQIVLCVHSTSPNNYRTTVSPLDFVLQRTGFCIVYRVTVVPKRLGSAACRTELIPHSGLIPSFSSRFYKHLLVELMSAAARYQRKCSSEKGQVRSDCREISIVNLPKIQNAL
jgi:hypothetical protein